MSLLILAAATSFTMTSPNLCDSQTQYSFEISSTQSSVRPGCVDNTRVINTQNNGRITYFSSQQSNSNWGTLYVFEAEDSGRQAFSISTQATGSSQYIVRDGQNSNSILARIDTSDINADSFVIRNNSSSIMATANKHLLTASNPNCASTEWSINNSGNLPAPVLWYLVTLISNSNFKCDVTSNSPTECRASWSSGIIGMTIGVFSGAGLILLAFKSFPRLAKNSYAAFRHNDDNSMQ